MDEQSTPATTEQPASHPVRMIILLLVLVVVSVAAGMRYRYLQSQTVVNPRHGSHGPGHPATKPGAKPTTQDDAASYVAMERVIAEFDRHVRATGHWPSLGDLTLGDDDSRLVHMRFGYSGADLYDAPEFLVESIRPSDRRVVHKDEHKQRLLAISEILRRRYAQRKRSRPEVAAGPMQQVSCPFKGLPINPTLYHDVDGVRIYTCCTPCLPKVRANPNKAIDNLREWSEYPVKLADLTKAKTTKGVDGKAPTENNASDQKK
jgi:hypothetical protein